MRRQPRDDRPRDPADHGHGGRERRRAHAGRGIRLTVGYPPPVRLNRYLSAAGLGSRRSVEGLVAAGRVAVDGVPALDPARRVVAGERVTVDDAPLSAPLDAGVVLHRPHGAPILLVYPGDLHAVLPLEDGTGGVELLLADGALARRLGDPRFRLAERRAGGRRTRLAHLELGELRSGEWRPLPPRDLERLRLGARLPPRAGGPRRRLG